MQVRVLMRCGEEGIPVRGIHDSILVPEAKQSRASEIMDEELSVTFKKVTP